ncbi:hypothetical protein DCCM_3093 [Desulfocucumis palustris]|uniref:Uncharacterized protein n=1 Tax=Desulfocucumis palustris TaxID=1898651 RepID=A0A2L2XCY0_9FIRM|nr:hypothetical protein DCCM_3093 [Desulfocucumis palustris]
MKGKPIWKPLALRPATKIDLQNWFARCPGINIGIITGTEPKTKITHSSK